MGNGSFHSFLGFPFVAVVAIDSNIPTFGASTMNANSNSGSSSLKAALSKHESLPVASTAAGQGSSMNAADVLEREYLEMRALILQLAASMDRVQRSKSPAADQEKMEQLRLGFQILLSEQDDRANLVQMLFSNPYSQQWAQEFALQLDPQQR